MKPEKIRKILNRDGLAEAEEMTAASYKESKFTEHIGFMNHLEAGRDKQSLMDALDDTPFGCSTERYLRVAKRIGFEIVLEIPFKGSAWGEAPPPDETYYVLWRKDGILLYFDTYGGKDVNGGKFLYNWKFDKQEYCRWPLTSSGCMELPGVWVGDHDCREALAFHISDLEAHGKFLNPWLKSPHLWLNHYMDCKEEKDIWKSIEKRNAITAERMKMLPEHVRKAICID
jgi:hypothetical protein